MTTSWQHKLEFDGYYKSYEYWIISGAQEGRFDRVFWNFEGWRSRPNAKRYFWKAEAQITIRWLRPRPCGVGDLKLIHVTRKTPEWIESLAEHKRQSDVRDAIKHKEQSR